MASRRWRDLDAEYRVVAARVDVAWRVLLLLAFFGVALFAGRRVRVAAASESVGRPMMASESPRRTTARNERNPAGWSIQAVLIGEASVRDIVSLADCLYKVPWMQALAPRKGKKRAAPPRP